MARKKNKGGGDSIGPGPGHNVELSEDEKRALIYHHKAIYEKRLAVVVAAQSDLKAAGNSAKADCGKHAVADIKDLIALEMPKGSEALQADIDRKLRLARWANAKVGTQFSFVEAVPTVVVSAFEEGKIAGLRGVVCVPPHAPGSEAYQPWITGHHEGLKVFSAGFWRGQKPDALKTAQLLDGAVQITLEEAIAVQADVADVAAHEGEVPADLAPVSPADVSDPPFYSDEAHAVREPELTI